VSKQRGSVFEPAAPHLMSLTCSPSNTATFRNFAESSSSRCLTTSRPGPTTSTTMQKVGTARVVPHTRSSPPTRQTPRWMPGRSTAGASRASDRGPSGSGSLSSIGQTARSGGRKAREISGR
jgi:hypothetical protein